MLALLFAFAAGLWWSTIATAAQQSPSAYPAYTSLDVKSIPPAPNPGPANTIFGDPAFGSRILRVTDQNTAWDPVLNVPASFVPVDSGFGRAWNANSMAIKLEGAHGDGYWMDFDPIAFSAGTLHPVPFGATWEWSSVDPDVIYFLHGSQIAAYNKSTAVTTDLGAAPGAPPLAYMAVVLGADNWVCAVAGAGQQDTFTQLFCINPISPGTSEFIDVLNGTINGVPHGGPNWPTSAQGQVIGIHAIAGGSGANWLSVSFHQGSWGGNGDAVLDLATNTWSLLADQFHGGDYYWSGHTVLGNGEFANASGSQIGNDGRGLILRNPDNLLQSSSFLFVEQPPPPPNWCDADHLAWDNSASNPAAPILDSRYGGSSCGPFTWKGEIVAAAVDGSNTVWRFAHNHNGASQCYFGEAFAQISNDGRWALFSSPWDGTLGPYPGFDCPTRVDTFIVELFPAGSAADDFNRPDGPLGSNWTNQAAGYTILGAIRSDTVGMESPYTSRRAGYYNALTFNGDQYSQVLVSVLPRWTAGAAVRMQPDSDSYYAGGFDNNNFSTSNGTEKCRIWKYTNHVPSSVAVDPGCHVTAGDTLRLEVKGSTLQFYLNGVVRLTATDTALTGGNPGYEFIHNVDGSPVLDNWGGGNLLDPACVGECSSSKKPKKK